MKVQDVMAKDPICCTKSDDVAVAAAVMTDYNTSVVPVTEHHFHPAKFLGVITERDICTAVVAQGKDPYSTSVGECLFRGTTACGPGDSISDALARMRESGMLRLPVVSLKGELVGTICMGDIIRHQAADSAELFKTMSVICMCDGPRKMPAEKAGNHRRNKGFSAAS